MNTLSLLKHADTVLSSFSYIQRSEGIFFNNTQYIELHQFISQG